MAEAKGKSAPRDGVGSSEPDELKPFCGIIMPIAPMPGYDSTHWGRVRSVIDKAIIEAGYVPRMVSESEDVGVIHSRIVQNLYDDAIVVCDVSARNANVMFELGMRLAFDKPTIIVKDDDTSYSFDTQVIKHIVYRKDQRFDDVGRFQADVTAAILATVEAKAKDSNYSPFLSHFGKFTPKTIEDKEVPQAEFIMNKLNEISLKLNSFENRTLISPRESKFVYSALSNLKAAHREDARIRDLSDATELITKELIAHKNLKGDLGLTDRQDIVDKVSDILDARGTPVSTASLEKIVATTWDAIGSFRGNSA